MKILASGGIDEYEILQLNPLVDGYGVGTSIANAPVLSFALDIMEIEGVPMAKRGKRSGAKQVWRFPGSIQNTVLPAAAPAPVGPDGRPAEALLKPLITVGRLVRDLPPPRTLREYVMEQMAPHRHHGGAQPRAPRRLLAAWASWMRSSPTSAARWLRSGAERPGGDLVAACRGLAPARDFEAALRPAGDERVRLIAEVKRASPSQGVFRGDLDPIAQATIYAGAGAAAVSVLTDARYFHGSLDDLVRVRRAIPVPVLRKEFIVDEYQLWEAREAGADAVLLIVAALDDAALARPARGGQGRRPRPPSSRSTPRASSTGPCACARR